MHVIEVVKPSKYRDVGWVAKVRTNLFDDWEEIGWWFETILFIWIDRLVYFRFQLLLEGSRVRWKEPLIFKVHGEAVQLGLIWSIM